MKLSKLFIVPMTCLLLVSCNNTPNKPTPTPTPTPEPEEYGWNEEDGYFDYREGDIEDNNKYYTGIDYEDRGFTLMDKIHDLMIDTHKSYPQYSDFRYTSTYQKTSYNQTTKKCVSFYTGKEWTSYGSSMNREHVWPAANSSGLYTHDEGTATELTESYRGAGADMYHVMPCDSAVNSARANYRFSEIAKDDYGKALTDGGKYKLQMNKNGNKCEPDDAFKGDIARLAVYLYVHYNRMGKKNNDYVCAQGKTLNFSGIITPVGDESEFELLARWNRIDPPDDMEKYRNDQVEKVQGNRNPFIDHPEFVWKIFNLDL